MRGPDRGTCDLRPVVREQGKETKEKNKPRDEACSKEGTAAGARARRGICPELMQIQFELRAVGIEHVIVVQEQFSTN